MTAPGSGRRHRLCRHVAIVAALPTLGLAQSPPPEGDFIYRARAHDTLIGISRRLLIEPRRWPQIQTLNHIANPRRIPLDQEIHIPYSWLRLSPETAAVTVATGGVRAGTRNISPGETLPEGSEVDTGPDGSATLTLADGSLLTLQKSSALVLEEMRRVTGLTEAHDTRLNLRSGRLQTGVKPQGHAGRFEIRTPVAVSAVRGTEFRNAFDPSAEAATTETLEGLVGVSGSHGAVSVPADFGTRVDHDGAPQQPTQLLPPPDLQNLPGTHSRSQLHVVWPAVPGAAGYRVQLAPDPGFQSFLLDTVSSTPALDVAAPPDGQYWFRVRSVDQLGLEGRDGVKPFVQRQLPSAPVPTTPRDGANIISARGTFDWIGAASAIHYRIQLARDEPFNDLLFDRDVGTTTDLDIDSLLPGRYFWRIASVDDRGESGEWSATQTFTQHLPAPTPYPPTLTARELLLNWDSQDGVRYHIQISSHREFRAPLLDQTLTETNVTMPRPHRPGIYYARIETIAEDGSTTPFGEARPFEVPLPRWVKIVLPLLTLLAFVP